MLSLFLLFIHATPTHQAPPLQVISRTYDVQDIHIINHGTARHYKVATIRIAFDQNVLLSTTTTTTHKNGTEEETTRTIPITQASPEALYGLTRLQCDDHLIESCPTSEEDETNDYHVGVGQNIPQFLYALNENTASSPVHNPQNVSVPFRTILRLTHDVERPRANQYVAILVVQPKSTLFNQNDNYNNDLDHEEDERMNQVESGTFGTFEAWSSHHHHHAEDHALQRWDIEHLNTCTLHFLTPDDQITPNGATVALFGDASEFNHTTNQSIPLLPFQRSVQGLVHTKAPLLNIQEASAIMDETLNDIENHETFPVFAEDMKNILDFATMYDRRQHEKENELLGNVANNVQTQKVKETDKKETTSSQVDRHVSRIADEFAHSGMIVSLIEVMHRMGTMNKLKTSQYWELVEDGLTNMMIPNFVKMSIELTKAPILNMVTDMLVSFGSGWWWGGMVVGWGGGGGVFRCCFSCLVLLLWVMLLVVLLVKCCCAVVLERNKSLLDFSFSWLRLFLTQAPVLEEIVICPIVVSTYPQAECCPDGKCEPKDPPEEPGDKKCKRGGKEHAGECRETQKNGKRNCPVPFLNGFCPGGNK
jgi:hypothetical protein